MVAMPAGITKSSEAYGETVWNILGQTYTLKQESDASMAWHAVFPAGTSVPLHIHPTQDEFILVLEGTLELVLDGAKQAAGPGDLVRMPKAIAHGIFNISGATVKCLFWVSPTEKLKDLFESIHNLSDPAEIVRISAMHDVNFLPPDA